MTSDEGAAVIVLHGHGAPPGDAVDLASRLAGDGAAVGVALDGPVALGDGTLAWFDSATLDGLESSIEVIRATVRERRPVSSRVVVVGLSQGAAAAVAALGEASSPQIDALVLWSGFAVEPSGRDLELDGLDGVAVLVVHGDADDVVPLWMADDLAVLLDRSGALVSRMTIAGGGHRRGASTIEAVARWIHGNADRSTDGSRDGSADGSVVR